MSILTELRAALEAKQEAEAEHRLARRGNDHDEKVSAAECVNRAIDDLGSLLTTDTIRALLDVAEAADELECIDFAKDYPTGSCKGCGHEAVCLALAPLFHDEGSDVVQDAQQCPTCNGHGGGGGFDRNGSHTEERYCEYPCPTCGKEATDE